MATPLWFGSAPQALQLIGTKANGVVTGVDLSVSASVTNGAKHGIGNMARLSVFWVNITAIAGGSAAVIVKLQHSPDGGVTWLDTGLATSSLTATGAVAVVITCDLFKTVRLVATLSATTTPTVTYDAWLPYWSPSGGPPATE